MVKITGKVGHIMIEVSGGVGMDSSCISRFETLYAWATKQVEGGE